MKTIFCSGVNQTSKICGLTGTVWCHFSISSICLFGKICRFHNQSHFCLKYSYLLLLLRVSWHRKYYNGRETCAMFQEIRFWCRRNSCFTQVVESIMLFNRKFSTVSRNKLSTIIIKIHLGSFLFSSLNWKNTLWETGNIQYIVLFSTYNFSIWRL